MQTKLAETAGFCFGVDRAVALVEQAVREGKRVATLGPIIHNRHVIERFKTLGRTLRRRDASRNTIANFRKLVNQLINGGAGADAEHCARFDIVERGTCDEALEFTLRERTGLCHGNFNGVFFESRSRVLKLTASAAH